MKLKLLALGIFALLPVPLALVTPGCGGADNPKIAEAPPPLPPAPAEVQTHTTKVAGKKVEYGTHSKYQKAMDRLNK